MKVNPNVLGGGYAALVIFLWALVAIDYQERSRRIVVCLGNKKLELNKIILRVAFLVLGFMQPFAEWILRMIHLRIIGHIRRLHITGLQVKLEWKSDT